MGFDRVPNADGGRRATLIGLGSLAAMALPCAARAAVGPVRIALLGGGAPADTQEFFHTFTEELARIGFRRGSDVEFEMAFANNSSTLADQIASDAAARGAAILVATGAAIAAAAKLRPAIPLVIVQSGDPVLAGYADSYARPGRHITGLSMLAVDLIPKRLEMLREFRPSAKIVAFVASPEHAGQQRELAAAHAGAARLDLKVQYYEVRTPQQVDAALASMAVDRPGAALLFSDALMVGQRHKLAEFFLQRQIPSAAGWRRFPESGHLMSYGPERKALWRRAAHIVAKIVQGANPALIPIELPTVVELVINRTTAGAMQLKIPAGLLARADEVVD